MWDFDGSRTYTGRLTAPVPQAVGLPWRRDLQQAGAAPARLLAAAALLFGLLAATDAKAPTYV